MLGLSVGEIFIILMVGALVVGPKALPKIASFLARCYKYVLNLTAEAKKALDLDKELEDVAKIKKEVAQTLGSANPVTEVKKQQFEIDESLRGIQADMRAVRKWASRNVVKEEAPTPVRKGEDHEDAPGSTDAQVLESGVKVDVQSEQLL